MGIFTKKYSGLFIGFILLGSLTQVKAQCNNAVTLRCVSVDDANQTVTLTWTLPPNLISCGWQHFTIFAATARNAINYSLIGTVTKPQTDSTILISSLPASPDSRPIYFFIETANSNNQFVRSDTVSTIYLTVTNAFKRAELYWNAVSNPLPEASSQWYQIWREYNNAWSLIDSVSSSSPILFYWDTITFCDSTALSYQIQIADSTICTSTSNIPPVSGKFINEIPPPMVVMDTVSVTSSGLVDIIWRRSRKNNVIGYIIYSLVPFPPYNIPIDTVWGRNAESLLNYLGGGNPSDSILDFSVAALDSCGVAGPISNPENTINLKVTPNTCAQNNTLTWNGYNGLSGGDDGHNVGGYRIFYSENSQPFQLLTSLDKSARTYIDENLRKREYRCYYVDVYDSTHGNRTAASNVVCDSVRPPPPPKNNYLRTASVILNTSSIQIVGYIDSTSGAKDYAFQRSLTDSAGGFSTISTKSAPLHSDSISYIDNSVNPSIRSYRYRIITMDSCDKPIDSTNLGENMLLTAVGQPDSNILTWNDYRIWYEAPAYYLIYRSVNGINYSQINTVNYTGTGNTYIDYVKDITTGQGTFYYYIKAVENDTGHYPYPFIDTSYSNVAKAYQDPTVFIPDAFCPNGKNKIFIPVGVFIDVQGYDFSIFNRWGNLIFESNSPGIGWDGTNKGSKVVQEGIYIYLLTYTSSKGEYFQRKGTVMLLK